MRTILGAGALVAAILSAANAETWIEIASTSSFFATVDKDTVEYRPGHAKYWLRQVFASEHPFAIYGGKEMKAQNIQGTTKFIEMRSLVDVDCNARTFTNPFVRLFDVSGKVVSEAIGSMEPKPIQPNSLVAAGADLFCKQA